MLVSQCTMKTWLIAGSASSMAANCAADGGVNASVRSTVTVVPIASHISTSRSPYTPLLCTSRVRPGGTSAAITASLA